MPVTFKAQKPSRAVAMKSEQEILQLKDLCTHMDISVQTLRKIPTLSKNLPTMELANKAINEIQLCTIIINTCISLGHFCIHFFFWGGGWVSGWVLI